MGNVTRVGIDLAKKVFHVTAVDGAGAVVDRKQLRRAGLQSYLTQLPMGCMVAMEACGSAHHWVRVAMRLGHREVLTVSLTPGNRRSGCLRIWVNMETPFASMALPDRLGTLFARAVLGEHTRKKGPQVLARFGVGARLEVVCEPSKEG